MADTFWMGKTLRERYSFDEVVMLHDVEPPGPLTAAPAAGADGFSSAPPPQQNARLVRNQNPETVSSRVNIYEGLNWLVQGARTGDVLVFHYSGFGIEVDDSDGWENEGYSEAILPADYENGVNDQDYCVVLMEDVRNILTSAPPGVHVICVMDCDHSNTLCDPLGVAVGLGGQAASGAPQGQIAGLKMSSMLCGILPTQPITTKMEHSEHNRQIWATPQARNLNVKARWQPMVGICSPKIGPYPHKASMPRSFPTCFCYSASHLHQTSLEMKFADLGRIHGVLTYSFIRGLEKNGFGNGITHADLAGFIAQEMAEVR